MLWWRLWWNICHPFVVKVLWRRCDKMCWMFVRRCDKMCWMFVRRCDKMCWMFVRRCVETSMMKLFCWTTVVIKYDLYYVTYLSFHNQCIQFWDDVIDKLTNKNVFKCESYLSKIIAMHSVKVCCDKGCDKVLWRRCCESFVS